MAPKGRTARSYYELARIEIVLKPTEAVPKGVEVTAPGGAAKKEEKKPAQVPAEAKEAKPKKEGAAPKHGPHPHVHKHEVEKELAAEHARHEKYAFEQSKGRKTEVKKEG